MSGANNSLPPHESDERALEFLYKHAGDRRRAQFHLTTQVSGGAGEQTANTSLIIMSGPLVDDVFASRNRVRLLVYRVHE